MFELSPADAVRLIGKEYLYALHIHDNDGVNDLHWNPFSGVIQWDDFGKALREIYGLQGATALLICYSILKMEKGTAALSIVIMKYNWAKIYFAGKIEEK